MEIAEQIDIGVRDAPPPIPDVVGGACRAADRMKLDVGNWDLPIMMPRQRHAAICAPRIYRRALTAKMVQSIRGLGLQTWKIATLGS